MRRARTGRRPGEGDSRAAILAAARTQFAARGSRGATIRGIAAAAGVDPALVMYFFGSKEGLFQAAIELAVNPAQAIAELLEPGLDGLGERVARFYLSLWERPETREIVASAVRSAVAQEDAAAAVRGFLGREVYRRFAERVELPDAELRLELAVAQVFGVAIARHILRIEPLATAPLETVVASVGPIIQRHLSVPDDGSAR